MIYALQPITSSAWENLFNLWSLPYVQIYVNLTHTKHLSEPCQNYSISSILVFSNMLILTLFLKNEHQNKNYATGKTHLLLTFHQTTSNRSEPFMWDTERFVCLHSRCALCDFRSWSLKCVSVRSLAQLVDPTGQTETDSTNSTKIQTSST